MKKLKERIQQATAEFSDHKTRWQAMKQIKWVLACPQLGMFAGLSGPDIVPVQSVADAQVFDGRDNEDSKLAFYRANTGIHWEVQCVS